MVLPNRGWAIKAVGVRVAACASAASRSKVSLLVGQASRRTAVSSPLLAVDAVGAALKHTPRQMVVPRRRIGRHAAAGNKEEDAGRREASSNSSLFVLLKWGGDGGESVRERSPESFATVTRAHTHDQQQV